ncbi:hypothetical protein F443_22337, partial [Phytophthora nicotianae P1569]
MARIASEDKSRSLRAENYTTPENGAYAVRIKNPVIGAFDSEGTYKLDEPSVVPPVTSPEHKGVHMRRK